MNALEDEKTFLIERIRCGGYHPYLYRLNEIDWAIFGSLTWRLASRRHDTAIADWHRKKDFTNLLNMMCGRLQLRRNKLGYYFATEFGKSGEAHGHFLIARDGLNGIPPDLCAKMLQDLWTHELVPINGVKRGGGTAMVKPYDRAKEYPGVAYCLKREFNDLGIEYERYDILSGTLIDWLKTHPTIVSRRGDVSTEPHEDLTPITCPI